MSGENVDKAKTGGAGQARAAVPLALLFAAIVVASFAIFSSRIKDNEARLCEGVARNASEELAAIVDGAAASGAPLAKAIEENPGLLKDGIAAMAGGILEARPYIVGVSVAPSAIVKYHFPEEGSESLIGHDLLSNPERRDALTAAVERKAPVLTGPDESVDGGRVLFIRYPVFAGGKLWGFTSLTIDFDKLLESLAFEKRFPGFSFAFSDKDFIAGNRKADSGSKVSSTVKLPGAEWTLHVIPSAGWSSLDPFLLVLLVAGLAGAVLLFVALRRKPGVLAAEDSARAPGAARSKEARDLSAFDIAVREAGQLSASRERPWQAEEAGSFVPPNGPSPLGSIAAEDPAPPSRLERSASPLEASGAGDPRGHGDAAASAGAPAEGREDPPAVARAAVRAAAAAPASAPEAAGVAGTGLLRAAVRQDGAQDSAAGDGAVFSFGAEPAEAKKPREVKFIGPAVRGEVYMPERLISGEPGSLFARFAVVEKAEEPAEANAAASTAAPAAPIAATPAEKSAATPAATLVATPTAKPVATPAATIASAPDAGAEARKPSASPAEASERVPRPMPHLPPVQKNQKEFPFSIEEPAAAKAESAAKSLAILVVDDSEANREIMGRMLALRGFQADFAVSGEESIERCSRRAYDIVFMDCFMPGMDGYKASAALRQSFGSRIGAIVGMSARIGDQEIERCRQAGMDDLLAKPFSLKQLLAHLERL